MARRIGGFARRDSGVGGGGSGAFGAILEQGGGTLAARDAQPTRTDPDAFGEAGQGQRHVEPEPGWHASRKGGHDGVA